MNRAILLAILLYQTPREVPRDAFTVDNSTSSSAPLAILDNGRVILTVPDQPRASDGGPRYVEIVLASGEKLIVNREGGSIRVKR